MHDFCDSTFAALDIETTALNPAEGKIVSIAVSDGQITEVVDVRQADPTDWLRKIYEKTLLIHNSDFDVPWLDYHYSLGIPEKIWDTLLAEQLLTAGLDLSTSLEATVERRLGKKIDKSQQTSFVGMGDEPLSQAQIEYAKLDAEILIPLAKQQAKAIASEGLTNVWQIEKAVKPVFLKMMQAGIGLDRSRLDPLIADARERMEALAQELEEELTPHVEWKRLERFEAEQHKLDEWLAAFEAETERLQEEWKAPGFDPSSYGAEYADQTIDKKDDLPKGMKRWVKLKLKEWRARNPRPPKPNLVINPINLGSWQQVHAALCDLGLDLRDDKGKPTIGAKKIKAALADASPDLRSLLLKLLEYKNNAKLVQAFGDNLTQYLDEEGRIHTTFKQLGTDTGRPTASRPNVLQMPNKAAFRACFRAKPGHVFIVADYSQMELRILAELSQDEVMVDAFKRGLDLHRTLAAKQFYRNLPEDVGMQKVTDEQRKSAKARNFGIPYGMGPRKYASEMAAQGINVTLEEARQALKETETIYAQAFASLTTWRADGIKKGYSTTPLGRRRRFTKPQTREEKGAIERASGNFVIQGANADITKLAMYVIQEILGGLGGRICLQVYDEIVVEIPEEHALYAGVVVKTAMENAAKEVLQVVPVAVDCFITPSWDEKEGVKLEDALKGKELPFVQLVSA